MIENIPEKIKEMSINYMSLMIDCANDKEFKTSFTDKPHQVLNERVGMNIPDSINVVFESSYFRWPVFMVRAKDHDGKKRFVIQKGGLETKVLGEGYFDEIDEYLKEQKKPSFHSEYGHEVHLKGVNIDQPTETSRMSNFDFEGMDVEDVVLILPFIDTEADMLTTVKYGNSEIVLSSCS